VLNPDLDRVCEALDHAVAQTKAHKK
jgi:hypothetical protein